VEGIENSSGKFTVHASTSGHKHTFKADLVVHSAGPVPEIDDLDLGAAGVEWDKRGVRVNEFLQSVSNPVVYAAGDAAATEGPPLTPVANYDGTIVASNLVQGNHQKPNYVGIPTVVFTIPPLASVGLSEREAREQGLKYRVKNEMTSTWYSSRRVAEKYSGYKVLVEEGTDRILGAHLLGDQAGEVVNVFAVAIRSGMPAANLRDMVFAYPTHGSDVSHML
jgi:glutathione reductase (NADPH)